MSNVLEKELRYYRDNLEQLVQEYDGRHIVIKNERVIGVYDSDLEAVQKTTVDHALGTFLVQRCVLEDENRVQRFYSRVAIG